MPAGSLVTVPPPTTLTVRVLVPSEVKVAVQLRAACILTTPSKQSESALAFQSANAEPGSAVAVRVTAVPGG